MKLNWKIRFKSKTFLVALFSLVLLLAQQLGLILGIDLTVYNEQITAVFNTVLSILVLLGVVVSNDSAGLSDDKHTLELEKARGKE